MPDEPDARPPGGRARTTGTTTSLGTAPGLDSVAGRVVVLALVGVVALMLVGVAVAAWWRRHPTVFDEPEARSTVGVGERRPADEGPIHLAMVRP